jgi:acetyltransferase-like isoleucine patch superfamily enzyme
MGGMVLLIRRLRTRLYTHLLAKNFNQFGKGARVSPPFRFYGLDQMQLGERVYIGPDCWIHAVNEELNDRRVKIVMEADVGIGMGATISAAQRIQIGARTITARNVYISDHSHAFADVNIPIRDQGITNIRPVSIGEDSWLGQNAVVLPGVCIGKHCVVGANSVVNSSLPDFSVAVGAPARVVRRYNPDSRQWERVDRRPEQTV